MLLPIMAALLRIRAPLLRTSGRSRGPSNVSAYCWSSTGAFHANFSRTALLYDNQEAHWCFCVSRRLSAPHASAARRLFGLCWGSTDAFPYNFSRPLRVYDKQDGHRGAAALSRRRCCVSRRLPAPPGRSRGGPPVLLRVTASLRIMASFNTPRLSGPSNVSPIAGAALTGFMLISHEQYSCTTSRRHTRPAPLRIMASFSTRGPSIVSAYCWSGTDWLYASLSRTVQPYDKQEAQLCCSTRIMAALLRITASFSTSRLSGRPTVSAYCWSYVIYTHAYIYIDVDVE
ncbi:unnamed protein product [Rangifer tarandus platyrhynchus]|uniref:Uncharacterized protein n=1 Tax=Rangifer tarandus platyrhynchus TaxID=3082113 RepID=A0ABN8XJW8_RANTA|nr:unnamed protein product [Rangifer tarandus platyrhynchus]